MNKFKQFVPSPRVLVVAGLALAGASLGHAAVDTELSGAVTDTTTFWGTVYDLKLAIMIAGIGLAFLAKVKSRA